MHLSDKTIVITGASRGLGRALALRLGRHRPRLVLVGRDRDALQETEAECLNRGGRPSLILPCDVSCERQVEALATQVRNACAGVDVLVNNAGIGFFQPTATLPACQWRRMMEVNFYGAAYCTAALLPLLARGRDGYILNVGSLLSEVPLRGTGAYAASKCALYGFTRALQRELAGGRLRAGIVLPGPMRTPFHTRCPEAALAHPSSLSLPPEQVAALMERMIRQRARVAYAHRWILWLMRLKALLG